MPYSTTSIASDEREELLRALRGLEAKKEQMRRERPEAEAVWTRVRKELGDTQPVVARFRNGMGPISEYPHLAMPFKDVPQRGLSPLWIIAIFLSFSETVLGVAVIQTSGGIQVALTTFVIVFPAVVCGLFFLILWKRPYVFYPPAEFGGEVGVQAFVEAMHYRSQTPLATPISEGAIKSVELKLKTLFEGALAEAIDPKQKAALILRETADAVRQSVVQIDSRPIFGKKGKLWEESFDPAMQMDEFLNALYFEMEPLGLPAFSYGRVWALKDANSITAFVPAGSQWASLNGVENDSRTLSEVGLRGGMKLNVLRLGRTRL